ncbi:putative dsRNA-binding protein [Weissella soli]
MNGDELARGTGHSIKEAEKAAARIAFEALQK